MFVYFTAFDKENKIAGQLVLVCLKNNNNMREQLFSRANIGRHTDGDQFDSRSGRRGDHARGRRADEAEEAAKVHPAGRRRRGDGQLCQRQ